MNPTQGPTWLQREQQLRQQLSDARAEAVEARFSAASQREDLENQLQTAQGENRRLQTDITSLQQELIAKNGENAQLERQLAEATLEIGKGEEAERKVRDLKTRLEGSQQIVDGLVFELQTLQCEVNRLRVLPQLEGRYRELWKGWRKETKKIRLQAVGLSFYYPVSLVGSFCVGALAGPAGAFGALAAMISVNVALAAKIKLEGGLSANSLELHETRRQIIQIRTNRPKEELVKMPKDQQFAIWETLNIKV